MAITVQFGNVAKKSNSTYTGTFTTSLSCILKESCSILKPSLFVDIGNPSNLNYCYIADFNRFYYINDWTFERGKWLAQCSVDVMATYKNEIGASSQYILRASNDSDGSILDTMYPTKNVIYETSDYIPNPWSLSGVYIVGIVSKSANTGAVTYYAFSASGMSALCSYLFGTSLYNTQQITQDISLETWKSLYNPFQYVASCMFIPMNVSANLTGNVPVKVGYWDLPITASEVSTTLPISQDFSISWSGSHPDAGRGDYVYCNPYTQIDFSFQPFGFVQLPPDIVYSRGGIECHIDVDIISGEGTLYIGSNQDPYVVLKAQIGVPVKLAQMSTDVLGTATTAISGVAGTVSQALSGDIAGAIASGASAIDSTVRSQVPRLATTGGQGGRSAYVRNPRAVFRYFKLVDEDNTRLGRPLCQHRQVGALGGYMLCENAAVDIAGTMEESQRVQAIMNSGFYYE